MMLLDPNTLLTLAFDWTQALRVGLILLFLVACLFLVMIVLIQRPQGGGLAGAFGSGAGSGQTAFGARTGDALTVATILFFAFYLITAVALSRVATPASGAGKPADVAAQKDVAEKPAEDPTKPPSAAAPATATPGTPAAATTTPGATAPADGAAPQPAPAQPSATPAPAPTPAQSPATTPSTAPPAQPK